MLKDILPEKNIYKTELYGHSWEIEVKMLSYKAKQEYYATVLKNKRIKGEEIEVSNISVSDLLDSFKVLFFNGLVSLKIDGQEEKIDKETYEYLINNLASACEWVQKCIMEHNGNFFLAKK